jgi:hypothetical protein
VYDHDDSGDDVGSGIDVDAGLSFEPAIDDPC